jgi:hypothetical protein
MGMHVIGMCLMGVYPMRVHLTGVHLNRRVCYGHVLWWDGSHPYHGVLVWSDHLNRWHSPRDRQSSILSQSFPSGRVLTPCCCPRTSPFTVYPCSLCVCLLGICVCALVIYICISLPPLVVVRDLSHGCALTGENQRRLFHCIRYQSLLTVDHRKVADRLWLYLLPPSLPLPLPMVMVLFMLVPLVLFQRL